jgi:hypothetical protein
MTTFDTTKTRVSRSCIEKRATCGPSNLSLFGGP